MNVTTPHLPLEHWALAGDVVHLNHGSFGGCPRAVIDAANGWRQRLEAAPMRFFVLEWQTELDRAREALASFLRAPADRVAFVPNTTTGIAIALASTTVHTGHELLTTDHAYRACKNQLDRLAATSGARVVVAELPHPFDADAAVAAVAAAATPRTKLALLDHVTSPTALVQPIDRIVPALAARGITVIVDGAHAPGQLGLDIGALLELGVTWYAGNNHKWLCAPKGSGFLVASPSAPALRPVVTSHGATPAYGPANRFHAELDWMGAHDPTPHLTVPTAIATFDDLGWPEVIARNHALVVEMRRRLAAALGASLPCADDALGTMAALPIALPAGATPLAIQSQLLRDRWEVAIVDWKDGPLVRVSAHLYNGADDVDRLASKLHSLGVVGR